MTPARSSGNVSQSEPLKCHSSSVAAIDARRDSGRYYLTRSGGKEFVEMSPPARAPDIIAATGKGRLAGSTSIVPSRKTAANLAEKTAPF
jgi:hypothetical protein